MFKRSELNWLIYSEPLIPAQLVPNIGIEEYLKGPKEHKLND